jgi:uncharacterized membrane protein (UPF0182 family)
MGTRACGHVAQIGSHRREPDASTWSTQQLIHGHGYGFRASPAGLPRAVRERLIWTL